MAHAYVLEGDRTESITAARTFGEMALGLSGEQHPDLVVLEYGLFSVDDAREVARFAASSPVAGDAKLVVIAATRIFHEAQNALLKLFEEPPTGVTLILTVPSLGQLLPTLRSRVHTLSRGESDNSLAREFLALDTSAKEKFVTKLLERTKSDKEAEKQAARGACLTLVEGLVRAGYTAREGAVGQEQEELTKFLTDMHTFLPILHERSAPLKLIFEHLLLVLPPSLTA